MEFIKELFAFMAQHKKLWLLPVFGFLVIIGGLLLVAKGSAIAPFIYTLF